MRRRKQGAAAGKPQRQKYSVVKEPSYRRSFFSLSREGREDIFSESERQTFGAACERGIAQPILATTFHVYEPAMLIQEAWEQLCFEMQKMYEKRYGKSFSILGLLREKNLKPASYLLKATVEMMRIYPTDRRSLSLIRNIFYPQKELMEFAGKINVNVWASVEKIELYERLREHPVYRRKIEKLEKEILFGIYEGAVVKRFPGFSHADRDVLRKCILFPLKQDFFCVPKPHSRFKAPFYFVEVKSERVRSSTPHLTDSQKEFVRTFKGEAGILVLRMFFGGNNVKTEWLVPDDARS